MHASVFSRRGDISTDEGPQSGFGPEPGPLGVARHRGSRPAARRAATDHGAARACPVGERHS